MYPTQSEQRELPSGRVTFLFTDIESSTKLVRTLAPADAEQLFALHDDLLRELWARTGGAEVNNEGDSFLVAYDETAAALSAAVQAQRLMAETEWPTGVELKIRIGLHAGLAAPVRGGYVSLVVHQAARIMAAANGGQTLVAAELLPDPGDLPGALTRLLGSFQVRDFIEPVTLYCLDPDDFAIDPRPIRARPARRHNLVAAPTSLIGRDFDATVVQGMVAPGRAVSILGPGGMGKTRLAIESGLRIRPNWSGGVWFVALADITDPELIVDEIVRALNLKLSAAGDVWAELIEHLAAAPTVLILDNAEHLIAGCAQVVADLIRESPETAVIVTSREPLHIDGELRHLLRPLKVESNRGIGEAVTLFVHRARALAPGRADTIDLTIVAEICKQLDGLPLAIELAAARISVMTIGELRASIASTLGTLDSSSRSLPARHRTIEALIGWSYQLLEPAEQLVFRHLGVFGGSFSIEEVQGLGIDSIVRADVPRLLWSLVDKSLVFSEFGGLSTRYRLPGAVQSVGRAMFDDGDNAPAMVRRLADWLLDEVGPAVTEDARWLDEVGQNLANIRHVVASLGQLDQSKPDETAADADRANGLMSAVGQWHDVVHSQRSGIDELARVRDLWPMPVPARVALLCSLADLHLRQGDTSAAAAATLEAQAVRERVGAPDWALFSVERSLAEIEIRRGEPARAVELAERALEHDVVGRSRARLLSILGVARYALADWGGALGSFTEELAAWRELNNDSQMTGAHGNVAEAALRLGNAELAAKHQLACLDGAIALGQPLLVAYSLVLGSRLVGDQDASQVLHMLSAAEAIFDERGHELYTEDRRAIDESMQAARSQLAPDVAKVAVASGRALDISEAADAARKVLGEWFLSHDAQGRSAVGKW